MEDGGLYPRRARGTIRFLNVAMHKIKAKIRLNDDRDDTLGIRRKIFVGKNASVSLLMVSTLEKRFRDQYFGGILPLKFLGNQSNTRVRFERFLNLKNLESTFKQKMERQKIMTF
jgi:hypothetical protein